MPVAQERGQRGVERLAGADQGVVDAVLARSRGGLRRDNSLERLPGSLRAVRADCRSGARAAPSPSNRVGPVNGKSSSSSSMHVEHQHVVPVLPQQLQPLEQPGAVDEQVGDRAPSCRGADSVSAAPRRIGSRSVLSRGSLASRAWMIEFKMVALGAQRHLGADRFVEGHAADGVLLPQQQIGQARRRSCSRTRTCSAGRSRTACCPRRRPAACARRFVSSSNCLT